MEGTVRKVSVNAVAMCTVLALALIGLTGCKSIDTVIETEKIAFTTSRINDGSLEKGKEKVNREGVDGEKSVTYEITSEDGKELSREKISEEITKQPVSKIIKVGTYIAPEIVTETQKIAFKTERIDDPYLAKGEERVERDGIDGEKIITYEVTTDNGKEVSKKKVKEKIAKEPVSKIIKVGTYVYIAPEPEPANTGGGSSSSNDVSVPYGTSDDIEGFCKDGTKVKGNPSAKGKANRCYGKGGWVR
jgi:uncharacterized protein YabE (DUF348 family)